MAPSKGCESGEYFLLVKSPAAVHRMNLQTGDSIEQFAGAICDMGQPEGVAFATPASGPVQMWVKGYAYTEFKLPTKRTSR